MVKEINWDLEPGQLVKFGANEDQYYLWTGKVLEKVTLEEKIMSTMTKASDRWSMIESARTLKPEPESLRASNSFGIAPARSLEQSLVQSFGSGNLKDGTFVGENGTVLDVGTSTRDINMSSQEGLHIITHNKLYFIPKESPDVPEALKGHGGSEFLVHMLDGTTIKTKDLWERGDREAGDDLVQNAIAVNGSFNPVEYYGSKATVPLIVPKFMLDLFSKYEADGNHNSLDAWVRVTGAAIETEMFGPLERRMLARVFNELMFEERDKLFVATYGEEDYIFLQKVVDGTATEEDLGNCNFHYSITPFRTELDELKRNYLTFTGTQKRAVFDIECDHLREVLRRHK